jgi:orotidine-5'-phosphate decarboxylase
VPELFVALDVETLEEAVHLATRLESHVDGFKVGLELLLGHGPTAIDRISECGRPIFADAKLHDIPNTVERAARQLARFGARYVSVHGSGGAAMVEAARQGCDGILVVTVLTSLDDGSLSAVGWRAPVAEQVERLARLASEAGAEGVVCAVNELAVVGDTAPGLLRVTPGIRVDEHRHDQARVATPLEAAREGADILVVGRPITRAPDPIAAAERIRSSLAAAPES